MITIMNINLKQKIRIFLSEHELKQDKNKLSAITASTYKTIKDSTPYLTETKETPKKSIHETLSHNIKNWING